MRVPKPKYELRFSQAPHLSRFHQMFSGTLRYVSPNFHDLFVYLSGLGRVQEQFGTGSTMSFTIFLCITGSPDLDGNRGTTSKINSRYDMFTICLCISPDLDGNRGTTKMCPDMFTRETHKRCQVKWIMNRTEFGDIFLCM
jgi:hypothetical protein